MIKATLSSVGIAVAIVLVGSGAAAQLDMFDKAKEAVGSLTAPSTGAPSTTTGGISSLTTAEMTSGLREALRVGTEKVVGQLGAVDGFNGDSAIHIPLPESLQTVQSMLDKVGMGAMGEDLELRLNRAAEAAVPEAKALFLEAISEMTLEDAQAIYSGPDDAATRYFQERMTPPLAERMAPIVDASLADAGVITAYDSMMASYKDIPFVPDVKANLSDYVLEQGMDGMFHYVAVEEAAIRSDPVARTTEILKSTFGR